MKIFMYLKDDFYFEDFNEIKNKCILIFEQNPAKLFDKNVFFNILYSLQSNRNQNIIMIKFNELFIISII